VHQKLLVGGLHHKENVFKCFDGGQVEKHVSTRFFDRI